MTYAYLAGLDKNDNNLLSLKVDGLKIMVMHHQKLAMPQNCLDCKVKYYPLPGEMFYVSCVGDVRGLHAQLVMTVTQRF